MLHVTYARTKLRKQTTKANYESKLRKQTTKAKPCKPPLEAGTTMLHVTHARTKLRKQTKPGDSSCIQSWCRGALNKSPLVLSHIRIRKQNTWHERTSLQNGSTLQKEKIVWAEEAPVLNSSTR
jgi:hypothetical protein